MDDARCLFSELFKFCPFIQCGLHRFAQVTNPLRRLFRDAVFFGFERCDYFFGPAQHPAKVLFGDQEDIFLSAVAPNGCHHCHVLTTCLSCLSPHEQNEKAAKDGPGCLPTSSSLQQCICQSVR